MVTVMDYADIASQDSNKFAKKQSPDKPKPKKAAKSLAQKSEPKEKSFYEQILDQTVQENGKSAINALAQPLKAVPKSTAQQLDES